MGRQKGDGGRSKAKPSSSSLAASLLPSASSASTAGFGGYVGSSRLDHSVSGDHVASFSDVDGELALHLKRLARKDPTTKLKALASLSELIKQKPGKDNVSIIPQWAFEYKRLLLDYNREVRRAAHETMTSLVTSVGRDLAPHLKSLMGPWWFSQFDSVSDVSQAAKQSLQAAFPAQEKRLDALILCTNEIFLYLEENLKLTPQNLSDRAAALDEVEEIHQQVISSTLLAFAMLLDVLIREQLERSGTGKVSAEPRRASASATAIRFAEKLFAEHKYFIDFLKSQSPSIRSATYLVLSSLIRNIPHAFSEGNMKTIAGSILGAFLEKDPSCHASMWEAVLLFSKKFPDSWTYVNVQKAILGRFWSFLRNGCFGSRRISYPALVLFLDTVPPKAIAGESFFLEFFQNLWDGRNPFHSSNADRVAFFQAFKECFLWALQNASRYYGEVDSIHFQATLVDNILLKLLWEDYLFLGSSKVHERFFSKNQSKDDNFGDNKKRVEAVNTKYPVSYSQELGKSIVEIVFSIHSYDHNILSSFCAEFQKNCLEIFQLVETMDKSSEIEQVIQFILQLEDRAKQKGEDWPLVLLVGPALSSSFPLIRSLDSPDGARLLFIAVSLFGPRKVVREILHQYNDQGKLEQKSEFEQFVEMFKGSFVPWCMHGDGRSTSARLDLLLALLDDECFSEQWHSVITYAIDQENFGAVAQSIDSDRLAMLAKLLDKARLKIAIQDVKRVTNNCQGAIPNHWHHELLESTAVAIAHSHSLLGTSYSSFLCSVLGGSAERQQTSFVSRNALIVIFEELSHKLVSFILQSPVTWGRNAGSLLAAGSHNFGLESESSDLFERAKFALEVLDGSFFCLQALGENNEVVPNILAAIHIIDWQCYIGGVNFGFDDSKEESKVMLNLGKWVHALRCKMTDQFWSLNRDNRRKLGNILVLSIRSAIFENDERHDDEIPSLCCQWMLEVLTHLSQDPDDEQFMLDQLLTRGNSWPFYVNSESTQKESAFSNMKSSSVDIQNFGNQKFVSLVNKLISKIGIEKVVVGRFNHVPSPLEAETGNQLTSRAWLAAEILCTWKWPGGSAIDFFLSSLTAYIKGNSDPRDNFLDSIFNMLLDGALVHGGVGQQRFITIQHYPSLEVEEIQEPFLRAIANFLVTLFKDHIWGAEKATTLLELLVDKLFIGEEVNIGCLKILPVIVSVLTRSLWQRSSESDGVSESDFGKESFIQNTIEGWLQRTLSFAPLILWQSGEDMEDWFHLIISCYPFSGTKGVYSSRLKRKISSREKELLLELFRKQRQVSGASPAANQLPMVQMLLSELQIVSVDYCWEQFNEEDWDFLLSQIRRWIQTAVVMMEEITEAVDDAITNSLASTSLDVCKKLEQIVLVSDPFPFDIARNSLLSFSLFPESLEFQHAKEAESINVVKSDKRDSVKDRILEGILRLFFCTGLSEVIANSCSHDAASVISSSRLERSCFWDLVASHVAHSPKTARERAMKSVEFWGLSKGPISSLYAILFSSNPLPSLQSAAYVMLSTDPICHVAITKEEITRNADSDTTTDQDSSQIDLSSEETIQLKEEISYMIERLPIEVLDTDLTAQKRVNAFLAWSLLLSHIWSLPSSTPAKERLVHYIQNSTSSMILDCLFQHIPVESMLNIQKKKDAKLPEGLSEAAAAAKQAITTGSLFIYVESLWPIDQLKMASFAGAIFGLMLCILPAYVRGWFSDLRDRSESSGIESFTRAWCSPSLIVNELSQIKKAEIADENFSVSVSKAANEIVATYTKDETGMDLVIRLPPSYPLRLLDVECMKSLGISEVKKRKWLLSMTSFLRNQNGALAEAIGVWKRNYDKEFEGVEECPICYSVIHTSNHRMPRLACRTCKHKFHDACLYRWFQTSHKSSCPLCQSPF